MVPLGGVGLAGGGVGLAAGLTVAGRKLVLGILPVRSFVKSMGYACLQTSWRPSQALAGDSFPARSDQPCTTRCKGTLPTV